MNFGKIYSSKFDELYTPFLAIQVIRRYIPKWVNTIWEPTAVPESNIVKFLQNDYDVLGTHISNNEDFFEINRECDIIITNPPYSLKDEFLERLFELDKPFMVLLPLTTLESKKRSEMFRNHPIQVIIPDQRFDFSGKNNVWFQTSWFCYKCNLKKDMLHININEHLSRPEIIQYYLEKNKNKWLDEILDDLRNLLKIKDRSIKDYLKELGYKHKKRSKTEKSLMNILDAYKGKEKITVKVILNSFSKRTNSDDEISKEKITERTVFNFFNKYPYYKNLIKDYNSNL